MNVSFKINTSYSYIRDFIFCIPECFNTIGEVIYKDRNEVKRISYRNENLIIKRYKSLGIFKGIIYTFFRSSKAKRAYFNALRLNEIDILTPEPIAYCHVYKNGLIKDCYFLSKEYIGNSCFEIHEECESRAEIIEKLVEFLSKMHKKGFFHADAGLSNFLYNKTSKISVSVIDTNRAKFSKEEISQEKCLVDLSRLSHDKKVLSEIVKTYAKVRGWDEEYCSRKVLYFLNKFEKRKIFLYKLKGRKLPYWAKKS